MKTAIRLLILAVVLSAIPASLAGTDCGNGQVDPGEDCDDLQPGAYCCFQCSFSPGGTLCRSSAGPCDEEEYCPGDSPNCPSDQYKAGNLCRDSAGECDVEEYCNGSSVDCPQDQVDLGRLCRDADGPCDQAEYCDDLNSGCPPDQYLNGDLCRPTAHQCDLEEVCPGDSPECPDDYLRTDGASCGDSDACTVDDACQGGVCEGVPPDTAPSCIPPPSGMVSWWPAEGTPEDIVGGNDGTLLNETGYDADGRVRQAFRFDGSGDGILVGDRPTLRLTTALTIDAWIYFYNVPNNSYAAIVSKWFQDARAAYLFVVEQVGDSYRLRAHFRLASGSEPSILGGTLLPFRWYHVAVTFDSVLGDAQLYIDGVSVATSPIATEPLNSGAADFSIGFENDFVERYYNGLIDEVEVFNRALTEVELLAIHDACGGGKCTECLSDSSCDDRNECTDDTCVNATCIYESDDTNSCSDGDACTSPDVCRAGLCVCQFDCDDQLVGEACDLCTVNCNDSSACTDEYCDVEVGCVYAPRECNDQNPCTTDSCDPSLECVFTPRDTNSCDQGIACIDSQCVGGICVSRPVTCDDGNACTQDRCDVTAGGCVYTPITCDDGNACTADSCNPQTGCRYTPIVCDDRNKCTVDSCDPTMGCKYAPKVCTASDSCHNPGVCNPSTGTCSNPSKPTGATCDDGNACTRTDTCQYGACRGNYPVTCQAQDSCHSAGVCAPTTGQCSNPLKPNNTTCSDGTLCTRYDKCQAGVCTGTPVVCANPDSCHNPGTCNPSTGTCTNPAKPNGTTCSDGNPCTRADSCSGGYCRGTDPVVCTASDSCHQVGVCNPSSGVCSDPIKPNGSTCSDGDSCTVYDTCQSGQCRPGGPPRCPPCILNGDATVKQSNQYGNYGSTNELQARGTTPTWALLRFHVSGVTGQPVTGVHVKLTVKSASSTSGGTIHRVACSWSERYVTWYFKPALGPALDTEGAVVQGQVVDFDVSSVVVADGDYCFAIDNPAGTDVLYNSREASSGRPQIVVDAGCACVP